jgi:hypothetical protein
MDAGRARTGVLSGFFALIAQASRHPVGLVGVHLITFSVVFFVAILICDFFGLLSNPYLGIFAFLVLPGLFLLGLVLVPIGIARARRGERAGKGGFFPILDLNRPEQRQRVLAVLILTGINLLILGVSSFKAVHYMDSSQFCGLVCHQVMQPEYTAYIDSPHARVECVDCHIGPGANWFVKAKLSGLRQVAAVATGSYSRPIPSPVHQLRPARETCEQCHWPEKFHGDRIKVKRSYSPDRENSEQTTVLLLKVGGGSLESGFAEGIHWHMNLANHVEYIADSTRGEIYWVGLENQRGEKVEYTKQGLDFDPKQRPDLERRVMDCMDCHNRPTHAFKMPDEAVDLAIQSGQIPRELPFVRREAVRVLEAKYGDRTAARREIDQELRRFYREVEMAADPGAVAKAVGAVQAIYERNIFPAMGVEWGTYPNHIGHTRSPGCFRCHDGEHTSQGGKVISQDCENCHHLLAVEENEPEVLTRLYQQ